MTTYIRLLVGQINAYRQEPFQKMKGYKYIETEEIVDEFSFFENGKIKRLSKEKIDNIKKERIIGEKINKKNIIMKMINTHDLLLNGSIEEIEEYRAIYNENLSFDKKEIDFEYLETKVLKLVLKEKCEKLEELRQLYNSKNANA